MNAKRPQTRAFAICAGWLFAATLVALPAAQADAAASPQPPPDAPSVIAQPEEPMMHDMGGMDMSSMQGGRPPPAARDPDYSEGQSMSTMPGMHDSMNDNARFGKMLIDQLEYTHSAEANGVAIDAQAYYGSDANKLWFKVEGERSAGHLRQTRTELLWDHAAAAFWDSQFGARHDFGDGPGRTWAAFGVQGLSPYWFDIEASVYVGQSGRTAARVEAQYDLALTQRLIFTPDLELNAYGKTDAARHVGAGLANAELGLRLRYEFTRQFAPYIGIDWNLRVGKTADLLRAADEAAFDHGIVAGVHIWF